MRHSRSDYQDRIIDTAAIIPEDEPVFLLRGQDPAAPATLEEYGKLAQLKGCKKDVCETIFAHANLMRKWQEEHPESVHPADLP